MPKCKYCHENITKFDKEICPFCGGKKPLEGIDYATDDLTQTIETIVKGSIKEFKQHKKSINALLCMFFGFFGADSFYLGFVKYALIRLLINIVLFVSIFLALYFLVSSLGLLYSLLIAFGSIFLIYFLIGISLFFINGRKDSNGVFIR